MINIKIFLTLFSLFIFLFFCPFAFSIFNNNIKLINFSNQLELVERLLGSNAKIIARGRQIYVSGNDEACSYRATRVYRFFNNDTSELEKKIKSTKFRPAINSSKKKDVDLYLSITPLSVIVTIDDGPYSAGFDIRCW